ncbi:MAG TPA: hypothetical protein VMP01_16340 [Pirellulaceae bacterium]|nr:hypothetical protein [Pirellulaceae bacterium]
MTMQLTVTLPDELAKLVSKLATMQGRPIDAVATEAIESYLASLGGMSDELAAFAQLTDEEVLAAADYVLPEATSLRLSELRQQMREHRESEEDRREFDALMEEYYDALLRKSLGWAEAVRRRLRKAPAP